MQKELWEDWCERTFLLLGRESVEKLHDVHVLVAGLGGVGGMVVESLCRAGIGHFTLVDADVIHSSNINRQIIATTKNIGVLKVKAWQQRILEINPSCKVQTYTWFLKDEKIPQILDQHYDFVVDCIDTLAPKTFLLYHTCQRKYKVISSLGSGGRIDPMSVRIGDISETSNDRLGYYLRKRLHKLGIYRGIPVVYSKEPIRNQSILSKDITQTPQSIVGTISYMPMVFGLFMSSYIIRSLLDL
ncbi:MAG: tRNA threonylcarbamoyladenosine dehydratase [Bacteroidales bacterium]|nr:tRNA threonylcarbamoyladenosine dehydratase [Bacteroidales bacterium]